MKRFVLKICMYMAVLLMIVVPVEIFHLRQMGDNVPGGEVRCAIHRSKTKVTRHIKKLIIGDSTGHALYPCEQEYDSIVSMACNRAVTMAGHYFLLKQYLETNSDNLPDEVILLMSPFSFSNDLDKYAYQYFLKPFPMKEYKHLYTKHLMERVQSIPLYWSANWLFIRSSGYTPRTSVPSQVDEMAMSKVSYEYLLKIDSITHHYNVPFRIVCTPVRSDRVTDVQKFVDEVLSPRYSSIIKIMTPYVESIQYMDADCFSDEVHLHKEKLPYDFLEIK